MKKLPALLALILFQSVLLGYALWYQGAFLPDWIGWKEKREPDRGREFLLARGKLTVLSPGGIYFESPPGWRIQDFLILDVDREPGKEAVLLVWKHGSFGKHRPTWVEKDTADFSQHIFIYKPEEDRLRPIWMSSALDMEIRELSPAGEHDLMVTEPGGRRSSWGWITWGLMRLQ